MDTQTQNLGETRESYATLLKELISATTDVVKNEVVLAKEEAKEHLRRASSHALQTAIFGALVLVSILPFTAFLIIGLGQLMGDRYWLSSLIVAVVYGGVGGLLAYRAYINLKRDMDLPLTRQAIEFDKKIVTDIREPHRRAV